MSLKTATTRYGSALFCLAALGVTGLSSAAGIAIQPGAWELTIQTNIQGMPMQTPPHTTTGCVTPKDARDPKGAMRKMILEAGSEGQSCRITRLDTSGRTVRWAAACTGPQGGRGNGEVTFDSDTAYHGTMHMSMQGPQGMMMSALQNMHGRRVGECAN